MKLNYLLSLMLATVVLVNGVVAQNNDDKYKPRPFQGKDILLDVYTGYPNWGAYFVEKYVEDKAFDLKEIKGVPHIGGRLEFIISEEFGFTFDALFDSWGGAWTSNGFVADSSGMMLPQEIDNSFQVSRLKVQIGATYHLDEITVEDLDLYLGVGIGSNKLWVTNDIVDTSIDLRDESYFQPNSAFIDSPISVRARVGGRYFIKENVAINLEISLGGPLITGGLSFLL